MRPERIELRLVALPTRATLAASHDDAPPANRELVFVHVRSDEGEGWGECSALNRPTYTAEFARGCFEILRDQVAPAVFASGVGGQDEVALVNAPMAAAGFTMAVNDMTLRSRGVSLAHELGVVATTVAAGAALGLGEPLDVANQARALAEEGYRRIKLKVAPGVDMATVEAVQTACPELSLHLDANGAYSETDLPRVIELSAAGVVAIEQPFAPAVAADVQRELMAASTVPILADESVASVADAERLHAAGLLGGVSIKAPKLGSIGQAKRLHDLCVGWGLPATAGGMLESGLGRHALAALAALPGFTLVGDVSPAGRWLLHDPWPDLTMVGGRVEVPSGPGICAAPDLDLIDRFTIDHAVVVADK